MKLSLQLLLLLTLLAGGGVAQERFRVGGLALDAPPSISGSCHPSRVHFTGRINATGPGEVQYEWIRSDNATAPVHTLRFEHKGPLTITYDWDLSKSYSGWAAFRVIYPNKVESRKVNFSLDCGH